ncbi:MAG: 6-phosphogluconolactonase [Phycisphaeraceae bacterium]|nr:MAG: 6-phosphogluconolactonase [Phycisphaeraceae bacterium]
MPGSRRKPDPYAITPPPAGPRLPGASDVIVCEDVDAVIDRIAAEMVVQGLECVRRFGDFHLALSGGRTPEPLYQRLMYDPACRALPWRRTHLWLVDERLVPHDHAESNYRMIRETIVDHADIPPEQVHPISTCSPACDEEYERELREHLMWREKGQDRLDFVLLGMGADGHTASLFPYSDAVNEDARLVRLNRGGQTPSPGRVTMTYPLLNSARYVAVMVTGFSKAETIRRVASARDTVQELPILGVRPTGGDLVWYLDREAAGLGLQGQGEGSSATGAEAGQPLTWRDRPGMDFDELEGDAPPFDENEFK